MFENSGFIPNILICGDKAEFLANVGQRPFKIVGEIKFFGEHEGKNFNFLQDGKFLMDNTFHDYPELVNLTKGGGVDYLVFNDSNILFSLTGILQRIGCARSQVVSLREFKNLPTDYFIDFLADLQLLAFLKDSTIKTVLDVDAHFVNSQLLTKSSNDVTEIDCIFDGDLLPIKENIFSHVYKNFYECQYKHYDAAIVSVNSPIDFDKYFLTLENCDVIIIYSRHNSPIENHLRKSAYNYEKIDGLRNISGNWFFCYRRKPPEDFAMYVVTHKKLPAEHVENLPAGYKIIHAGRAISDDFGYLGDNTGDNVSHLNPYINEITALYWMWKNTSHSVIGLSHYRRFFTESEEKYFTEINDLNFAYEKILTAEQTLKILKNYDIIVTSLARHATTQFEDIGFSAGVNLINIAEPIIKKNILNICPEYAKTFEYVMDSSTYYECQMFITRQNLFKVYCEWLFSIITSSWQEISRIVPFQEIKDSRRRLSGWFYERLFTTWIIKNNLRVKELNKMFVNGI